MQTGTIEWPYPIKYDEENEVSVDVLILGGGISGCHAAISAAKKGAKVAILEKGPTKRSGAGGAGVDHWQHCCTNPASKVTPEELTNACNQLFGGYNSTIKRYIACTESYDTLLELEQMGVKVRDSDDEFKGAAFRDEATKLLFAYDYENKYCTRIWGAMEKLAIYKECKRLGIEIYDRVMVTSLLNEGGKQGARVVGATGLNTRTGEFYIFKAKATILCAGLPERLWTFSTELRGFGSYFFEPNCTGEGVYIGWKAGAEFAMMEKSFPDPGGFGFPPYGVGNADNTWYACNMVDADGKEIPWVDRDGNILKTFEDRYRPAPGQKFFVMGGGLTEAHFMLGVAHPAWYDYMGPTLIHDLPERIRKGEFKLPLYADLPSMPEHERKAIFGLMVAQEGKTLIPVYQNYTEAGFDPDKDLLQAPVYDPETYAMPCYWGGAAPPQWRSMNFTMGGGAVIDWDLRTTVEGLYSAGMNAMGGADHSTAACTGRYAGRSAAEYAKKTGAPEVQREQVEAEKDRVYAPIKRDDGVEWKELNAGIARVMQNHCGDNKSTGGLEMGLSRLDQIREAEMAQAFARNPHELMRAVECMSLLNVGEMVIHACLARKASSFFLAFKRLDYPDIDPQEYNKFITIKLKNGGVEQGELPLDYALKPPYAPTYKENYDAHSAL